MKKRLIVILLYFLSGCREKSSTQKLQTDSTKLLTTIEEFSEKDFDTLKFYINWVNYFDNNNSESGEYIYANLPDSIMPINENTLEQDCKMISKRVEIRAEKDMDILYEKIKKEDTLALKIRIKMNSCFGVAWWGEYMDISVGQLIRINPKLFLIFTKRHMKILGGFKSLGGLTGNFGPDFVDDSIAYITERDERILALQTVKEPDLVEIRDSCINALRK